MEKLYRNFPTSETLLNFSEELLRSIEFILPQKNGNVISTNKEEILSLTERVLLHLNDLDREKYYLLLSEKVNIRFLESGDSYQEFKNIENLPYSGSIRKCKMVFCLKASPDIIDGETEIISSKFCKFSSRESVITGNIIVYDSSFERNEKRITRGEKIILSTELLVSNRYEIFQKIVFRRPGSNAHILIVPNRPKV